MLTISDLKINGYKKVIEAKDPNVNLHCFIAIHNTSLGPALGGTRIHPYASRDEALNDVLRLAKGMTYKSALAETGFGGGKSVIIADPKLHKTEQLLQAFGSVVDTLKGDYIAAEDVGTSEADMLIIHQKTPYVAALPTQKSSGDPSPYTAWGVFRGIQAVAKKLWKTTSLKNKRIAIQGLGHVGSKLAGILFWEGADLIFDDVDPQLTESLARHYGAEIIDPPNFFKVDCDIISFCAFGGVINDQSIPLMKCKAIAGAANNQLLLPEDDLKLFKKGILYAPDYVINAGGIINATLEFALTGYHPKESRNKVDRIYETLLTIFERAEAENKPTNQIANEMAEYNLAHQIGKRPMNLSFLNN